MWQHRNVTRIVLDLRGCLRGHETAIEYLTTISPFFDVLYTSLAVENLSVQFAESASPADFSRALLNQYENVSGCNPERIPDWVMEHVDVIALKTIRYLDEILAHYRVQRPDAVRITVFDYERIGQTVAVKVADNAGDQSDAIDQAIRVSEFRDTVEGLFLPLKIGAPLDERAVEPQPAPRGSTQPSAVAPQARSRKISR